MSDESRPPSTPSSTDAVKEAFRLILADRPRWQATEHTAALWESEFGNINPDLLLRAVRSFLRSDPRPPSIAKIHEAIDADLEEQRLQTRVVSAPVHAPGWESCQEVFADLSGMNAELAKIQAYRKKNGFYDHIRGKGRFVDTGGSLPVCEPGTCYRMESGGWSLIKTPIGRTDGEMIPEEHVSTYGQRKTIAAAIFGEA